ncbi:39S ribosomal protein L38, mitochondrial [Triplophysa rosa]|uniref:Large ribosomal subunit protein mL38 n=1 Tax=Triplophysa rosa TaxID=992332 RepID=A0A9W7THA0_TRIRA|nr:39S ribosomal protein L38, mitochondrial [Triplophysa rosa]KAI7796691.1 putative 39S ribosomal protein L38 [Triplophysa rosa]
MALRSAACVLLRTAVDVGFKNHARGLRSTAVLGHRSPPLGPMPNEDIDCGQLDSLEKYGSYARYVTAVEEADRKEVWWRTYRKHREEEMKEAVKPINIGLPYQRPSRKTEVRERKRLMTENKRNPELERADRLRDFRISVDKVKAEWEKSNGPYHIQRLAEHYGVYKDLFPMAYFVPRVMLRVAYGDNSDAVVHYGNHLTPTQAAQAPQISYEAEENSLWTLLLTSPDEHLMDGEQEYLHWLVGNIPGKAVMSGEEICHYIGPFPARGTGFHRFIFILFKQDGPVDFSSDQRPAPCYCLKERTFRTLDFYRKHQAVITPAGLAFHQSQWDRSVTDTFHQLINMREPVFEYERPPAYHPPQRKYPHGQPLRYLDRYRNGTEHTYGIY